MYSEHSCFKAPYEESTKVWRYLDFTKFVSLLDRQAIFFVKSEKLSDPFEGMYSNANKKELELITKKIQETKTPENGMLIRKQNLHTILGASKNIKKDVFLTSWHENEYESAAMWKLYLKSNEGVSIQSNLKRLKNCFSHCQHTVHIGKVEYVDYETFRIPMENAFEPYLYKRKSFEHEHEIRAITTLNYTDNNGNFQKWKLFDDYGIYVPVSLNILIEKIFVCPDAPDWFLDLVKSISEKYGLDKEKVTRSSLKDGPLY